MFRLTFGGEYEAMSEGGTRHLFALGHYRFVDSLDEQGQLHHCVLDSSAAEPESAVYETDPFTMYEIMARFLAGEYEKREYDLELSPAHHALLDTLEIASARARGGESDFEFDDIGRPEEWDEAEEDFPGNQS